METGCRIELFGGLRVTVGRETIARFPTQKAGLLLAYLALTPGKLQTREHLIDLLWPDLEPDAGRNNLSTLLSLLRRVLEPRGTPVGSILQADRQTISLNVALVQTDVGDFDRWLQQAARATETETRCQLWRQAAELVTGEFLPGCYEEWALRARTHYSEAYAHVLRQRASLFLEQGRYAEAQEDAAKVLQADACDEAACQLRMRAFAGLGRVDSALQAYAHLEQALQTRLESAPDAATRQLKARIQTNPDSFRGNGADDAVDTRKGNRIGNRQAMPPAIPTPAVSQANSIASAPAVPAASTLPTAPDSLPPHAPPSNASSDGEPTPEKNNVSCRLPMFLTRFFGREREKAELQRLLHDPDTRLVTLLGMGGAGKTRLAVEVGRAMAATSPGRVWFVALADIPSPALMPMLLLNVLDLPVSNADPLDAVLAALADVPGLLILDNMEHLLWEAETKAENTQWAGAQALVRLLLERLPHLTCLVTSRQALNLEGEQEYALPPLATPGRDANESDEKRGKREALETGSSLTPSPSPLLSYASVALYVDRAQKAKADFTLTERNAEAVAALCRKLEGMPLALEMAAAWIKTVPPARMLERLEHQLEILVSRRRDLPPRQQSLRATCEWSYDLLSPELKPIFRSLSVFRGGWTLEAAEAVCKEEPESRAEETPAQNARGRMGDLRHSYTAISLPSSVRQSSSLNLLAELQERSLIFLTERENEEPRYRMLEPLREFGMEQLAAAGQNAGVLERHARYFAALAATAKSHYQGAEETSWLATLKTEQDNLRAALAWLHQNNGGRGLRMAADLSRFWELSGALVEGQQWLADMLAHPDTQAQTEERALALRGAGVLSMLQADYASAKAAYTESLAIFTALDNRHGQANALNGLGNIASYEQLYTQARAHYEQSLAIRESLNDAVGIASSCHNLGNLEMLLENYDSARAYMECAVGLRRKLNDQLGVAYTLGALGQLARKQGLYEAALPLFCEITHLFHRMGVAWAVALSLRDIAEVLWSQGERWQVVCLLGAVQALREATTYQVPPAEREMYAQQLDELCRELGDREYAQAWAQGYAMNRDQAVAYTLQLIDRKD